MLGLRQHWQTRMMTMRLHCSVRSSRIWKRKKDRALSGVASLPKAKGAEKVKSLNLSKANTKKAEDLANEIISHVKYKSVGKLHLASFKSSLDTLAVGWVAPELVSKCPDYKLIAHLLSVAVIGLE